AMMEGDGVFPTWKRPRLKGPQPVNDDGQQRFLGDAVEANLFDRAVLEEDICPNDVAVFIVVSRNVVMMTRPTRPRLIRDLDGQLILGQVALDAVVCQLSHLFTASFSAFPALNPTPLCA